MRGGRDRVRPLGSHEDRQRLADANHGLFLSLVQGVAYRPQRDYFAWDHIFPVAKATLMTSPGPNGWRVHHRHRRDVNSAGNLWALDPSTNCAVGASLPAEKFRTIRERLGQDAGSMLPHDHWWLTDEEIDEFSAVGPMLERGEVDPAMELFHELTSRRAQRLVGEVLGRFPIIADYAKDAETATVEARMPEPIAPLLGVILPERPVARLRPDGTPKPHEERSVARILANADELGCGPGLRRFVDRALALGLQVRGWKVSLALTPPNTKNLVLVTLTPRAERDGRVTTWVVKPDTFVQYFPDLPAARFRELLARIEGVRIHPLPA